MKTAPGGAGRLTRLGDPVGNGLGCSAEPDQVGLRQRLHHQFAHPRDVQGGAAETRRNPAFVSSTTLTLPSSAQTRFTTNPLASRRLTTCDNRDNEEFALAAGCDIRSVLSSASERFASTRYSNVVSPVVRCRSLSRAAGSSIIIDRS